MTMTDPDVTRAVRSWLDEGADRLPDRVLDSVLASVPMTRQRRSPWPVWRFNDMTNLVRIAAVTAAVVAVGVVGYQLLPSSDVGAGPAATPAPTSTSEPSASAPAPSPSSELDGGDVGRALGAGTHRVGRPFTLPFEITLPAGYEVQSLASGEASFRSDAGYLGVLLPEAVFPDPCAAGEPVAASTPDEFITALSSMAGFTAEDRREVTIGGLPATSFLLTNTVDTSTGACARDRMLPLFTYVGNASGAETNSGLDELFYVLEVDGRPVFVVVDTWQTPEGLAELQGIVGNIRFD